MSNLADKARQSAELFRDIKDDLLPYWFALTEDHGRIGSTERPDSIDFGDDGDCIRFLCEYNDACHCHPERVMGEFTLDFDDLEMTPEEFRDAQRELRRAAKEQKSLKQREKVVAQYQQAAQERDEAYIRLKQQVEQPMTQGQMYEQALKRPKGFDDFDAEQKWAIDKSLGILDWDGSCPHQNGKMCEECQEKFDKSIGRKKQK